MTEVTYDWATRRTRRQPPSATGPAPIIQPLSGDGTDYGRAALASELQTLIDTGEGGRNHQLNKSTYSLAQLVAAGHLPAESTYDQLRSTALRIGLATSEVEATLRSAQRAGVQQPREVKPLPEVEVQEVAYLQIAPEQPTTEAQEDEQEPRGRTTWWPEPITQRAAQAADEPDPTHLVRDDGRPLLYSGKVNALIGESESGKSWIALLALVQAVGAGQRVLFLDFEDSAGSVQRRLTALGVALEDQERLVDYADPQESLNAVTSADLSEALAEAGYQLIIADGVNAAMTLLGYDLNSNTDATLFTTKLLRPLARTGACVVTVDHVPKNPDARGKGGIGAQAKRAMIDGCTLLAEVVEPFGKGQSGIVKLTVDKDRGGAVRGISSGGRFAGKAHIESVGDQVRLHIAGPDLRPTEDREPWQPTGVMEQVSRLLERVDGNPSFRSIKDSITGREKTVKEAIAALADGGYIRIEMGPNRSQMHRLVKPYRESEGPVSPVSPGVSQVSPGDTQASVSHPIPPYGDGRHSAAPMETPVSPAEAGDTQPFLDGHSSCNQCGEQTPDEIIDETAGYCRRCAVAGH